MKKLFTLALAFACSMSMWADRLFMVGDATPQGWNNLAGQRISKAQKGINIVNGKKVLF